MHIYTPVEFIYIMFLLLDPLLFTTEELSPDSVTATLSNTKVLKETVFCTILTKHSINTHYQQKQNSNKQPEQHRKQTEKKKKKNSCADPDV